MKDKTNSLLKTLESWWLSYSLSVSEKEKQILKLQDHWISVFTFTFHVRVELHFDFVSTVTFRVGIGMALVTRFLKLQDHDDTHVFTFVGTKSVTRDLDRDITSKDFRFAINFINISLDGFVCIGTGTGIWYRYKYRYRYSPPHHDLDQLWTPQVGCQLSKGGQSIECSFTMEGRGTGDDDDDDDDWWLMFNGSLHKSAYNCLGWCLDSAPKDGNWKAN